ncbi:MAG: hypothetical protein ACJ75J_15240 [Cytophagaceae bacterium]
MENQIITKNTELKPSDIIRNPAKGKIFRIDTYQGNKETFKIYPWPVKSSKDDFYIVVKKDNLIAKKWELMSKEELKTAEKEAEIEMPDDSQNLFIKEGRQSKEDNY